MKETLLKLVQEHGTPLFIIDHNKVRGNYQMFKKHLPRIQTYYAVKANSNQEIIKTLFNEGASFDVASYNEFMQVYEYLHNFEDKDKDFYIWDKIIFSNTIKDKDTLKKIKRYKPLMTYDNFDELIKIKETCDTAGLVLRLKVPDTGSLVEMGSKFGAELSDAYDLVKKAFDLGLTVEGLSFHVGSQCTNFDNYVKALQMTAELFNDSRKKGYNMNIIDIGGGFPVPYDAHVPRFEKLAEIINSECERLFPKNTEILAEPGRFIIATAGLLVSGVVYDHWIPNFYAFKNGETEVCAVVGPTCDSFDKITLSAPLPANLEIGDYLYTNNIGAYSVASSTRFNGFYGAKVIHTGI